MTATELPPVDSALFRRLFENAPCGYVVTDADGVITLANATFAGMTGYPADSLVGRQFSDLLTVGSKLFHETRHLPVLRLGGRADEIALSLQRADGTTLPTLINSVLDPEDPAGEMRIAVFDSTERRDYERDLLAARRAAESSESYVRVLQQASTAFTLSDTVESLSLALADSARDAFAATHAAVLVAGSTGRLELSAGEHPLLDLLSPGTPTPEAQAISLGEVVTLTSRDEADAAFPGLGEILHSARLEAMMTAPLVDKGLTVGAVSCFFGRRRQFNDAAVELFHTLARQAAHVLARIRLQEQLARLALMDQLTGLANRKLLQERLTQSLAAAHRGSRSVAVIFLDLDGFKVVNDECGHAIGDSVLQQVAERLRSAVRASDTIGRYGGDEFVVICDDTDADAAALIADRIRAAVRQPLEDVSDEFPISASVGVALLGPHTETAVTTDGILGLADAAMYQSKNAGKDRTTIVYV